MLKALRNSIFLGLLLVVAQAQATVTTATRSITYSPGSSTSNFTVTFHFLEKSDLLVTRIVKSTEAETALTNGVGYTVTLPVGATQGIVSTTVAVTSLQSLRIERIVPFTQTTSFKTQGTFSGRSHENAFDKLTMAIQQINAGTTTTDDITTAITTHSAAADPHTVYHVVAGVAGGQSATGGDAASENLTLRSTSDVTKGKILFGTSAYDENTNKLGIGTTTPSVGIETTGDVIFNDASISTGTGVTIDSVSNAGMLLQNDTGSKIDLNGSDQLEVSATGGVIEFFGTSFNSWLRLDATNGLQTKTLGLITVGNTIDGLIYGGDTTGDDLYLAGNSAAANGNIFLQDESTYDGTNERLGIGTLTPAYELDVRGVVAGRRAMLSVDTTTISAEDCNSVTYINSGGSKIIQLPAIASAYDGCEVTVLNLRVSGGPDIFISPNAADVIRGTCSTSAADVEFTSAANVDIKNVTATQNLGDQIKLVGVLAGINSWFAVGCSGTWANGP